MKNIPNDVFAESKKRFEEFYENNSHLNEFVRYMEAVSVGEEYLGRWERCVEEIEKYKSEYNSAYSSYCSNRDYYTNRDKASYESKVEEADSLDNKIKTAILDIETTHTNMPKNRDLLEQVKYMNVSLLDSFSAQKLSHLLIKAIETNNEEIIKSVKDRDFDPAYKSKDGKYLLAAEIIHGNKELFDLTLSKKTKPNSRSKGSLA
jgi:hypothetical protein